MKKVIITGANGFIGSALVLKLIENKIHVIALDMEGCNQNIPNSDFVKFFPVDLLNISALKNIITDTDIDVFYHFAWAGVAPEFRNNFEIQKRNIDYCYNCLDLAITLEVKKFILPGSAMEYIYNKNEINRYSIPTPDSVYGSIKIAVRFLCEVVAHQKNIDFIYLIITGVYGANRLDDNIITYTIKSLLKKEKPILTDLKQIWNYIHINDLLDALLLIGEKSRKNSVYSIGSNENMPLFEYIKIIHDLIDFQLPLGIGEKESQSKITNSSIDLTELVRDTGFKPKVQFINGIKPVIEHIKDMLYEKF